MRKKKESDAMGFKTNRCKIWFLFTSPYSPHQHISYRPVGLPESKIALGPALSYPAL